MVNALFQRILQCVSRYTATRLVFFCQLTQVVLNIKHVVVCEERASAAGSFVGVTCVHVPGGMSMSKLQEGLDIFTERMQRMQPYQWF